MQLGRKILLSQNWQKSVKSMAYSPSGSGTASDVSSQSILYGNVGNTSINFYSDVLTASIWFKRSTNTGYGCFLNLGGTWSGYGIGIGSNFNTDDDTVRILRNNKGWDSTDITVSDTSWHQYTIVWGSNSAEPYKVYVDGTIRYTSASSDVYSFPYDQNDIADIGGIKVFGYNSNSASVDRLFKNGAYSARLVLWNRRLTDDEVAADYSLGKKLPDNTGNITHMYSMEVEDGVVKDLAGSLDLNIGSGVQIVDYA